MDFFSEAQRTRVTVLGITALQHVTLLERAQQNDGENSFNWKRKLHHSPLLKSYYLEAKTHKFPPEANTHRCRFRERYTISFTNNPLHLCSIGDVLHCIRKCEFSYRNVVVTQQKSEICHSLNSTV